MVIPNQSYVLHPKYSIFSCRIFIVYYFMKNMLLASFKTFNQTQKKRQDKNSSEMSLFNATIIYFCEEKKAQGLHNVRYHNAESL